jgi:hypothetical protein
MSLIDAVDGCAGRPAEGRRCIPALTTVPDLLDFLTDLHAKKVDLFLHQQVLHTSTPSGRAMFQMLGGSLSSSKR